MSPTAPQDVVVRQPPQPSICLTPGIVNLKNGVVPDAAVEMDRAALLAGRDVQRETAVLVGFAVVFFVVGVWRFRYE